MVGVGVGGGAAPVSVDFGPDLRGGEGVGRQDSVPVLVADGDYELIPKEETVICPQLVRTTNLLRLIAQFKKRIRLSCRKRLHNKT